MLASMNTQVGLTVIGPKGVPLRILRKNPAYVEAKRLLAEPLPAEQVWDRLQALVGKPLAGLITWCEQHGMALSEDGTEIKLGDLRLSKAGWLPLLTRTQATGGSPKHVLAVAEALKENASGAPVAEACFQITSSGTVLRLVQQQFLPAEARPGDKVTASSKGSVPFLVGYDGFEVSSSGTLLGYAGIVLAEAGPDAADILKQPFIKGLNQTYRCEEGSVEGWLADFSYDSLASALINLKEIQNTGAEGRIVNRLTGQTVPM